MNLKEETIAILKQYGLRANRKLGQNFLIEETVLEEIVVHSAITREDTVIEIGPGIGSLTNVLLAHAKKVIAIELDSNMVQLLKTRFCLFENFELIEADVLKTDLKKMVEGEKSVKVVANLPYYITTPIIMKLLEEKLPFTSITVMVQKEVGERLCATHQEKAYGAITVSVQYYTRPQMLLDVPKEDFFPSPEVDSCVIQLTLLPTPRVHVKNEKVFFQLVKGAFSQRRKTILNSLTCTGKSKEEVKEILNDLQINPQLRAENLSIENFAAIANRF